MLNLQKIPATVIGNGMIAQRFNKYMGQRDVVIFASGVSNSKEIDQVPYLRERMLLESTLAKLTNQLFVYFSTYSVNDPIENNTPYIKHKLAIEQLIRIQASNYLIIRASNVVGGLGNKHTILNYFWEHIQQGKPFVVWQNATRNLIDLDDLYMAVKQALKSSAYKNQTLSLINPHSINPLQLVRAIEMFSDRQAIFEQIDKGISFNVYSQINQFLTVEEDYWQPNQYIHRLLHKYYL